MIIVAVAGKFDPLHDGHRSHIEEASKLGNHLIVITHPDDIVAANSAKGLCYQSLEDRIKTLFELPYVDAVVVADDEGGTVARMLKRIKPDIFAKGGDRTPDNMPENEVNVCEEIGCEIVYGVGVEKTTSSTSIVKERISEQLTSNSG